MNPPVVAADVESAPSSPTGRAPTDVGGDGSWAAGRVLITLLLTCAFGAAAAPGPFAWTSELGFRRAPLPPPPAASTGFTLLASSETGVTFTNLLTDAAGAANRVLENGSGVAAGDVDGDDWPDLFFCSLTGQSRLYRNLGHWRFVDITDDAGLNLQDETCRGAVFVDLNGDRRLDLLVSTLSRGVRCYRNQGAGHFREFTSESGLPQLPGTTTLALADVDDNGTLDLYITRYRAEDVRDDANVEARVLNGRTVLHPKYEGRVFIGPAGGLLEYGEPDQLLLNDGQGHFSEVSWTQGAFLDESGQPLSGPPRDWGLTGAFHDFTGDGKPDLYVCNDYWTPDRIWFNSGHGTFRAAPPDAIRHTSENSMGVDFADLDRDGHVDLLVLDMLSRDLDLRRRQVLAQTPMVNAPTTAIDRPQSMRNVLFRNRGDQTFAEIADYAGLPASDWSWQPLFLDVDLDGDEDILIPAGHRRDVQDLDANEKIRALQHPWTQRDPASRQQALTRQLAEHGRLYPPLDMPLVAFRNLGQFRFQEVTTDWRLGALGVHQGSALADLDGDGDLDLIVNNLNSAAGLYRNDSPAPRLAVRLRGLPPNTQGVGARITLRGGPLPLQHQEITAGGRYLSGSESLLVFASGTNAAVLRLEVAWRNGKVSVVTPALPNHLYEIDEAHAQVPPPTPAVQPAEPLFADLTPRLGHVHVENEFDDFARQPLLPRRLSRLGPGVAWCDLNGDGLDDLLVAASANGSPAALTNDTRGGFQIAASLLPPLPIPADQSALLGLSRTAAPPKVLIAYASYEHRNPLPPAAAFQEIGAPPASARATPGSTSSPGPLCLADLDGDGDLDLFVGGRVVGGRYPEPATSRLYLQEPAGWREDPVNTATLRDLGLVSGATWCDLDGDGDPDLALACDWGPLRVFRNDQGTFREVTREWGLEPFSGCWHGVAVIDADEDGRLDLVASNWGLNSPDAASPQHPAVLAYGDLLQRGVLDLVETAWDLPRERLVPRHSLEVLQPTLPPLRQWFPTHRAYTAANLDTFLEPFRVSTHRLQATTLASTLFLNRGTRFEARELPAEAQFAPAFGLAVADFDGDTHPDLVLAQNFFGLPERTPRLDAGRGLLLLGLGDGSFVACPASRSGIRIDGEQRAAAVSDYDADGRPDLVVTQNNGPTRLLRGRGRPPGLRVRLQGPPGNPTGIGTILRPRYGDRWGAAHPILAGSGYWSQDSAVPVFGGNLLPTAISARWPDGRRVEVPVPPASRELVIQWRAAVVPSSLPTE